MKKILLLMMLSLHSLFWSAEAAAAPCSTSSLASYIALGSGGCTINGTLFSDFTPLSPPAGAVPFASISVTPVLVGSTIVGVDFGVDFGLSPGTFFDDLISYRVTGIGFSVTGASLLLNGYGATGLASVTAIENLCLGGTFLGASGVDGCSSGPSSALTLVVADSTPDSATFAAAASLAVVTDIGVDSGPDATDRGSLTSASNRFTIGAAPRVVPEPAPVLLLAVGLLAAVASRRPMATRIKTRS